MTPKKNETFSRVRTTRADCHDTVNRVMRFETCHIPLSVPSGSKINDSYLQLEVLDFSVEIFSQ